MKEVLSCQLAQEVPEVIRLLPLGEVVLADQRRPFQVTPESLAQIVASWQRRGHDVVIDYEHQSLSGQEAPAAGWIKELWAGADGLYARVAWTDRARDYLARREYRYFSPVVQLNEARQVVDLLHVALTNCPAISQLPPLVMRQQQGAPAGEEDGQGNGRQEGLITQIPQRREGEHGTGGAMIERLRTIFGLGEEAGEPEITAMAMELMRRRQEENWEALREIGAALGLAAEATAAEVIQGVQAVHQEAEALRQELARLIEERREEQAAALVQEALARGKTTPAELDQADGRLRRLAKEDPEFFRVLILSRRENWAVPGPLAARQEPELGLTAAEMRLCEILGVSPEAYKQNRQHLEQGE
jgi:phage I-like protein